MQKLRKALVLSVMSITVLSMSMLAVPFTAGAAAQAGDLIKMDGLSSVYYLGDDGKRYVFPNESTYFSWYADFSSVVTIPQSELEGYPLGKNVTVRSGTKLIKITTNPNVYAVGPAGVLYLVPDEATAEALYGADWAGRVVDIADSFFTNYDTSGADLSSSAFPTGSLVKYDGGADVYRVNDDGTVSKVADEAAFNANGFNWDDVLDTALAVPTTGDEITGADSDIMDVAQGGQGSGQVVTPGAGTGLTVALSSDTPASGNIPAGSPNEFLVVDLTASNDGPVSVNTITLAAYDLGDSTYIDSVTFYRDGLKVGTSKNMTSDRIASFNFSTPIEVGAGETVSLTVKATIETGQTGNFAIGVASASAVTTNGATVSGSFPVQGNTLSIVGGVTIGSVALSAIGTTNTTNDFGEDNVLLAEFNLTASDEPIIWESARFKNAGTNNTDIVSNLRILVDGDEVATAAGIVDKYVDFSMGNFLIAKNDNVSVEVYGDLGIGNVGNTVDLYIDDAADFQLIGQDYGYGVLIDDITSLDQSDDGIIVTLAAGDFIIDMDKSATPAKDVKGDSNDVVLATINMTSNGENATLNSITETGVGNFYIAGTGLECAEIENIEMRDVDSGVVYDITETASTTVAGTGGCTLSMTDEISFVQGVTRTFEVRVDIQGTNDANGIDDNDKLQVALGSAAMDVRGDESDADITDITPSSISSSVATAKDASLTWTTTALTNKTIVPGAEDVVIYQATAEAGDSSDVTLTAVQIDVTSGLTFDDNNVAQLDLYLNDQLLASKSNNITNDGAATGYINFTSLNTANRTIAAGTVANVVLKATFASSFSSTGVFNLGIEDGAANVVAKDSDNNNVAESVTNVNIASRAVTLADTGTLKVELDVTDQKANANTIVLAGGTETSGDKYVGKLKFTTANESVKVKTLVLGNHGTAADDDILSVELYDENEVQVASRGVSADGHANFNTLDLILPADDTVEYFIGVTTKSINADGDAAGTADHDATAIYTLASTSQLTALGLSANEAVTAEGVDSGATVTCDEDANGTVAVGEYSSWGNATSTTATISGSILTSVVNAMSDGTLTGGNGKTIAKYTFVFNNGDNRNTDNSDLEAELNELILTTASSSGVIVANVQAYIEGDSANKTTAVQTASGVATIDLTTLSGETEKVDGTVTLVIVGDVSGVGTNAFLQTEIDDLTTDFTYDGNDGSDGSDTANALLTISEVIGGTLSN